MSVRKLNRWIIRTDFTYSIDKHSHTSHLFTWLVCMKLWIQSYEHYVLDLIFFLNKWFFFRILHFYIPAYNREQYVFKNKQTKNIILGIFLLHIFFLLIFVCFSWTVVHKLANEKVKIIFQVCSLLKDSPQCENTSLCSQRFQSDRTEAEFDWNY